MGFLTERPPATVEVGGREVPVNADYRVMLRIDELPDGMPEAARGMRALQLFYGEVPADVDAAAARMLWFMQCGKKGGAADGGGKPAQPDFSFSHDGALIYAAFLEQYGIDLVDVPFLHWWTFRALLDGLSDGHLFCEVRRCRAMELGRVKDKEQQRYYREMKKRYALPLPEGEQGRLDAITEALLHGGDVNAVL